MKSGRFVLVMVCVWMSLVPTEARIFDSEDQYVRQYGANVNKGVPAPPPHKFAIYHKKNLRILVLFENLVSQGELLSKPKSRLSDVDVTGILAINQGSSSWKKEQVETTKDPKAPQVSLWSRSDGKLFALYVSTGPLPLLVVGTKSGGDFLIKNKDSLAAYVKD